MNESYDESEFRAARPKLAAEVDATLSKYGVTVKGVWEFMQFHAAQHVGFEEGFEEWEVAFEHCSDKNTTLVIQCGTDPTMLSINSD